MLLVGGEERGDIIKKVFLLLILFFSINVHAKDYYSEYKDFSDWSPNSVMQTDTVDVEIEERYKYYYEDIIGTYYIEGENDLEFPYIDYNDSYYSEFSDYSDEEPEDVLNRVIETKMIYEYKVKGMVKYIMLYDIYSDDGKINFTEINLKDNRGNKIEYELACSLCNDNFPNYIRNGIIKENMSYVENGGYIRLYLMTPHIYDDINLEISIYDNTSDKKEFDILVYNDTEDIMAVGFFTNIICKTYDDIPTYTVNHNTMQVYPLTWDEFIETDIEPMPSEGIDIVYAREVYRYKDLYYYYYKYKKTYSDYLEGPTNKYPYKSEYSKLYYRYRERDKVSVPDGIDITSRDENLRNYIISTTKYQMLDDIDKTKNGIYTVRIRTYFGDISFNVNVDIPYNTLLEEYDELMNLYLELLGDHDILEDDYNSILSDINILNEEIRNKNNDYDSLLNTYNLLNKSYEESKLEITKLKADLSKVSKEYDDLLIIKEKLNKEYVDLEEKLNKALENLENTNKENVEIYNSYIDEINSYRLKINELNNKIDKCDRDLLLKEEEKNKITKEFENQLININLTKKEEPKEEVIIKNDNKWGIITCLSTILLFIGFILYEVKKKN